MTAPADRFRQRVRRLLQAWQADMERNPEYGQFVSSYTPEQGSPEDERAAIEDEMTEHGRWVKME